MARKGLAGWTLAAWCVVIALAYFGAAKIGLELAFTAANGTEPAA